MSAIQELIKEIKNLKPVPAVVSQLIEKVDAKGASMSEIAGVIKYDPVVTANLLKTCNSAYFGLKNPAESVEDATAMLGLDQVVELVLLKSGAGVLGGRNKGYDTHEDAMWKYAVSSAMIAKLIADRFGIGNRNTIFTASLLKDIGKTVMDGFIAHRFDKINSLVINRNLSFREAEKKVIGVDHAELGGMIAKMWKFSPKMVKIIRHHHLDDQSVKKDREVLVVYLADCISMMMGLAVGADGLAYRFHSQAARELGVTADDISRIIADFTLGIEEVEKLLKIV